MHRSHAASTPGLEAVRAAAPKRTGRLGAKEARGWAPMHVSPRQGKEQKEKKVRGSQGSLVSGKDRAGPTPTPGQDVGK